jgi:hypothetical protein
VAAVRRGAHAKTPRSGASGSDGVRVGAGAWIYSAVISLTNPLNFGARRPMLS